VVQAVRTVLAGLGLPKIAAAEIRVRRRFERDGHDTAPSVIVVGELEEVEEDESSGLSLFVYGVLVGLLSPRDNTTDWAQWEKDTRQMIRNALDVGKLAGAPTVCNGDYEPQPAVNLASWAENFEVVVQRFRYWSDEGRNA